MPFINIPNLLTDDVGVVSAGRVWYEEESDLDETKTIRFAARVEHTGVLVKINKADFFDANS